ncbi:kynurenine/alpha-aminoadipate aminotransferase, mitochondrial [Ptiloglossa arizonensis]|uniref:kynurenine/alpha-aminoadipate aminotransferase, mitochondrial n=1 Tax=Ptiloglossa arizonensis TaxID=3350558 RepID=UPI003F9FDB37
MEFSRFLTESSKRRNPSLLRKWAKEFMERPNSISLANGMPNAKTFPFEEISVVYKNGPKVKLVGEELSWSLQYGPSQGYLPLLKKMREFQTYWHKPKYHDWDVIFTSGSMEGCSKVFEMTMEINDPIMAQVPTYNGVLNALTPLIPEFIGITQDKDGIIPEKIMNVCEERLRDEKPMPKILYVNPIGANPTGTVLTDSRKRKIYELAQKYDFLIIEDDPYYFLNFVDEKPTSFFEMDTDGRVIRLDSFSKILSAGLRLGVVTAHTEFIKKLTLHMESTSLHASSLSQMLLYKLFDMWNMQDFQQHIRNIQTFYRERRDIMLASIQMYLSGLVEYTIPKGGMFVWLKVNGLKDVNKLATKKCSSQGIFLLPGHEFNHNSTTPDQHLRISYSYATPEEIDKALSVLSVLLREEIGNEAKNKS